MLRKYRDSRSIQVWSITLSACLLFQIIFPTASYALTGGPSQPEVNSFTPIGTSDMVDPFSGSFNYNIPLMDVGGYPINLANNGVPNMDTEASWVGLGWNVNPGVINRSMRGIPDDFKGVDRVRQENNMRPNWTFGTTVGVGGESFGFDLSDNLSGGASFNFGISYNNYNGVAISTGASISFDMAVGASNTGSLGLSANNSSSNGMSISPNLSFSTVHEGNKKADKFGTGIGVSYNSRQGLSALTVNASVSGGSMKKDEKGKSKFAGNGSFVGTSGSIDFMNNTYVPNLSVARSTTSLSGSFKLGVAVFGQDVDGTFSGYFSKQELLTQVQTSPAYGYMYEEEGAPQSNVMLDFNREKQRAFNRTLPNIHTTNHSYDIFNISGQGVGGMFRPFRSEIGYVHDNEVTDVNNGAVTSLEIGPGNIADGGASAGAAITLSKSGNWTSSNPALSNLTYKGKAVNDLYEPFYFKHTGEVTVDEELQASGSLFDHSGGFDPVRVETFASGFYHSTLPRYIKKDGTTTDLTANKRNSATNGRAKRNQIITSLTKSEAGDFGIEQFESPSSEAKNHHLSEMTVLQNDGSRYVYGIPAYNNVKRDVSFNVTGHTPANDVVGTVQYGAGDNSINNDNGRDNYFNATELPGYAHSYLLTSVLSHDYQDVDGVTGPSSDDYGSYTKFEYGLTNGTLPDITNYKWRAPYGSNEANYSEGLKTDPGDQRASYVYGEKEVWYLKKIETKTHIAIFTLSNRRDGYGVAGENGGIGGSPLQKLDKISLYSKPDYDANGGSATPIKEVHFEYDYSLCTGIPNNASGTDANNPVNQGGKLTLKRLYFTYGNSYKGELSDYQFVYADPDHDGTMESNYTYNLKNVDGWGCFMENYSSAGFGVTDELLNSEFPYTRQDRTTQDEYANAWALTSILLPSGGRIDIDLEAKDYQYVQDKKAMQMFEIIGTSDDKTTLPSALSNQNELYSGNTPKPYLYFKLPPEFISSLSSGDYPAHTSNLALFRALENGESMYYRFLIDLTNSFIDADDGSYEYVEGYLHKDLIHGFNNCGVYIDGTDSYGYIKIRGVDVKEGSGTNVHPIAKSAWQFARMNNPRVAFDQPDPQEGSPLVDIAKILASQVTNIAELFTGANGMLKVKGYGKRFRPQKSWVRLNHPLSGKIGGGSRVKAVKMYDNWEFMSDDHSGGNDPDLGSDDFYNGFQYGQEYSYTMEDGSSSGVATYEPMGNKDNPLIQPVAFSSEHLLAPDDNHYQETPFGESFYPSPSVGHRRVAITNLQYGDDTNEDGILQLSEKTVRRNATGKIVHEFYTCLDYPVRVERTDLYAREKKTGLGSSLLKLSVKSYAMASQGFVIETNDMHGKPKTQRVYGEGQNDYISGVTYVYDHNFSDTAPASGVPFQSFVTNTTKLNNDVNVITPEGKLTTKQIGIDYDVINDFGESSSDMTDTKVDFNMAAFLASIIPVFVPTVWPTFAKQKTRYRYASTTKVINRFGILREVIAHDLGSSVSTRNLAWDSETGEVLLTETTNEYGDQVYNLNYPAHWYYSGMGQAYQNIGAELDVDIAATTGYLSLPGTPANTIDELLERGDELVMHSTNAKYWVEDNGTNYYLIDENGATYGTSGQNVKFKVLRSGHRNMQAVSIGALTMLENPLDNLIGVGSDEIAILTRGTSPVATDLMIQASVNEYSDDWPMENCDCDFDENEEYNPFIYNVKGTWRKKKSHLYLQSRTYTIPQHNREDGVFVKFNPFWWYNGNLWNTDNTNWTWTSEVTKVSPYGFELENVDRLGRYSAAQYDYNNNLPVAVGNNAQYREIGFDSFEEYHFDNCKNDHFSFESSFIDADDNGIDDNDSDIRITETTSHTGSKSFKLGAEDQVEIIPIYICPL